VYIALTAFVINVLLAVVLTLVFRALRLPAGTDQTVTDDYLADAGDVAVAELAGLVDEKTPPPAATSPDRSPA
jgi:SSS family solute:Na+ symporter